MTSGPIWLGSGNGVAPALTVQGGKALVFWFTGSESRLSEVGLAGGLRERVNPCTPDVGVGAVSASLSGMLSAATGAPPTVRAARPTVVAPGRASPWTSRNGWSSGTSTAL